MPPVVNRSHVGVLTPLYTIINFVANKLIVCGVFIQVLTPLSLLILWRIYAGVPTYSHALRGNIIWDALRPTRRRTS